MRMNKFFTHLVSVNLLAAILYTSINAAAFICFENNTNVSQGSDLAVSSSLNNWTAQLTPPDHEGVHSGMLPYSSTALYRLWKYSFYGNDGKFAGFLYPEGDAVTFIIEGTANNLSWRQVPNSCPHNS